MVATKLGASEKTEEELIGTLIKLRKRAIELGEKIDKLLEFNGDFYRALEKKWESLDPERWFKARMSVNPDRIIELAETLGRLQKEYKIAHQELREFENKHPSIAEKF